MNFKRKLLFLAFFGCCLFVGTLIQAGFHGIEAQSKPEQFICSKFSDKPEEFLNKNCNPNKNFTGLGQDFRVCCIAK